MLRPLGSGGRGTGSGGGESHRRGRRRRATTTVIGFVLVFSLALASLAVYQSEVVPGQNRQAEVDHDDQLSSDLTQLQNAFEEASTDGVTSSATVALAPTYPDRTFGVNPPRPRGRMRTSDNHTVQIRGLESASERYWNGSSRSFESRFLNVSTSYNAVEGNTYTIEQGRLVKQFPDGGDMAVSGRVVEGDQITLTLLNGSYTRTGHTQRLSVHPGSTTIETTRVTAREYTPPSGSTEDPHLWVPTTLSQATWDEIDASESGIEDVTVVKASNVDPASEREQSTAYAKVELVTGRSYDLRVARVSLNDPNSSESLYLETNVDTLAVPETGSKPITVTARDRYGNPVSGVKVNLSTTGTGLLAEQSTSSSSPLIRETDSRGEVELYYSEGGPTPGTVDVELYNTSAVNASASVDIRRADTVGRVSSAIDGENQLFEATGETKQLLVSDMYSVTRESGTCLLGDNSVLSSFGTGCLSDAANVVSFSLRAINGTYDDTDVDTNVTFEAVDHDQDGKLTDSGSYDGDDYAVVIIHPVGQDRAFEGLLKPSVAKDLYREKTGTVDLLDASNYKTTEWDNDEVCYDDCGALDGPDQEENEAKGNYDDSDSDDGHTSFDEVLEVADTVFVRDSDGHVTVTFVPS